MTGNVAGIVLAGGRSVRMGGGDKGLLALAGRPVLSHLLDRLRPQVAQMALNANGVAARFKEFDLPVVSDTIEGFAGPLAGILAGLEWTAANSGLDRMLSVAADTPFVPFDLVDRLSAAGAGRAETIVIASCEGRRHPVVALWPVAIRHALKTALMTGERRVFAFVEAHRCIDVDFPRTLWGKLSVDPFFNINTPADLAEAERLLESQPHE